MERLSLSVVEVILYGEVVDCRGTVLCGELNLTTTPLVRRVS
jgi:hypothetical protein